jgi:hypothetical protein
MTSGPGYSTTETSELLVIDSTHPIATDLPTTFAPANSTTLIKAVPEQYVPESANPVAVRAGVTTAHAVYTMSAGDVRADGTVTPAARVVLGLTDATLADLTDDGVRLVDNAVLWAADPGVLGSMTTALTPVGRWKLDAPVTSGGVTYFPNAYTSHQAVKGKRFANSTVTVAPGSLTMTTTGKHLEFPGYHDMYDPSGNCPTPLNESCSTVVVSPTKSALVLSSSGATASQDMTVYRPGPSVTKFQIKVSIKPDNFTPSVSHLLASQSPNVIQMGRKEDPGQWKISVETDMRPRCEFTGSAKNGTNPPSKTTIKAEQDKNDQALYLKSYTNYTLTCTLVHDADNKVTVSLKINSMIDHSANNTVIQSTPVTYSTFDVSPTTNEIWVGHKPPNTVGGLCNGCDAPGDSFAGGVDDIWISRQG